MTRRASSSSTRPASSQKAMFSRRASILMKSSHLSLGWSPSGCCLPWRCRKAGLCITWMSSQRSSTTSSRRRCMFGNCRISSPLGTRGRS
uniref:Uncharacterized protein n=1 Tax=Arundo donax TaxID=35708 RepID=A0A0A9E8H3_ARUDO